MQSKQNKIKAMLRQQGIDGAIVSSPENFHYVAGFAGHQHTVSRQPGFTTAVLSAREERQTHAITMDFEAPTFVERNSPLIIKPYDTWVGVKEWDELVTGQLWEPEPKDFLTPMDVLLQSMEELELTHQTVGLELQYLPVTYYKTLQEKLPHATFVDISDLFVLARSVKEEEEIQMFRKLCAIADEAFFKVSEMVAVGVSETQLRDCFRQHVIGSGFCVPSSWSMFSTGPNGARLTLPGDRKIADGDVVKFDAGVNAEFDFYTTDTSRGWVVGNGDPLLCKLKDRLYSAQRKMLEAARPGLPIKELFRIGYSHVQEAFPAYRRGHLGHSISLGPATAEAPYINATETRVLEPGMVLAIEVPCYIRGVNGFNIEDMVLITQDGCEVLTPKTPHYL